VVCHRTSQARAVRPPQRRWSRLPPDAGSELAAGGARAAKRMRLCRCSAVAVRPPRTVASWSTRGAVRVKASNLRTMTRGPPSAQFPARKASKHRRAATADSTDRAKSAWGHATGPQTARERRKLGAPAPQTDEQSTKSSTSPSERGGRGDKNELEPGG